MTCPAWRWYQYATENIILERTRRMFWVITRGCHQQAEFRMRLLPGSNRCRASFKGEALRILSILAFDCFFACESFLFRDTSPEFLNFVPVLE
jgi:hypothetical protein